MHCYIATVNGATHTDGWYGCLAWAIDEIRDNPTLVVKIHVARHGVKTVRIVAEVVADGVRFIRGGRHVSLRAVRGQNG